MPTNSDEHNQQDLLDKLLQEREMLGEAILQLEALLDETISGKKASRSITNKASSKRKNKDLPPAKRSPSTSSRRRASR